MTSTRLIVVGRLSTIDTKAINPEYQRLRYTYEIQSGIAHSTPIAYNLVAMVIIETSIFTKQVLELLTDDEYRELQFLLASRPDMGKLIPGSGGLRKARWGAKGQGKRGGVRIIYFWAVAEHRLFMVYMYSKNKRDDLTPTQLRLLRQVLEEE